MARAPTEIGLHVPRLNIVLLLKTVTFVADLIWGNLPPQFD
jgi:hypothetical protein